MVGVRVNPVLQSCRRASSHRRERGKARAWSFNRHRVALESSFPSLFGPREDDVSDGNSFL